MKNCTVKDNVIVACGNGVELWNKFGIRDNDGYANNKMIDFNVTGNIMAYIGYGVCNRQEKGKICYGTVVCTSAMEGQNCTLSDNVIMYCKGSIGIDYYSSDNQSRGWALDNNVYIVNPDIINLECRDNPDSYYQVTLAFYGFMRSLELNERNIRFFASMGIGPNERYLITSENNLADDLHDFMTGRTLEKMLGIER